jgi:hypothetical protein
MDPYWFGSPGSGLIIYVFYPHRLFHSCHFNSSWAWFIQYYYLKMFCRILMSFTFRAHASQSIQVWEMMNVTYICFQYKPSRITVKYSSKLAWTLKKTCFDSWCWKVQLPQRNLTVKKALASIGLWCLWRQENLFRGIKVIYNTNIELKRIIKYRRQQSTAYLHECPVHMLSYHAMAALLKINAFISEVFLF